MFEGVIRGGVRNVNAGAALANTNATFVETSPFSLFFGFSIAILVEGKPKLSIDSAIFPVILFFIFFE